jgi:hypothetical protein
MMSGLENAQLAFSPYHQRHKSQRTFYANCPDFYIIADGWATRLPSYGAEAVSCPAGHLSG